MNLVQIVDDSFKAGNAAILGASGRIMAGASALFGFFLVLDLALLAFKILTKESDLDGDVKKRLLVYAGWGAVFVALPGLTLTFHRLLVLIGFTMGGGTVSSSADGFLASPGQILANGLKVASPLWEAMMKEGAEPGAILLNLLSFIACMLAYGQVCLNYVVTYLEFSVVLAFGLIFIPMAIFDPTKELTDHYISAVVGYGTKLILTTFIIQASYPMLQQGIAGFDLTKADECVGVVILVLTYNLMVFIVPMMAKDLLQGTVTSYHYKQLIMNIAIVSAATAVTAAVKSAMVQKAVQDAGKASVGGSK